MATLVAKVDIFSSLKPSEKKLNDYARNLLATNMISFIILQKHIFLGESYQINSEKTKWKL